MGFSNPLVPQQIEVESFVHDSDIGSEGAASLLQPPNGWLWRVIGLDLSADAVTGGSTGTHEILVSTRTEAGTTDFIRHLRGRSAFGTSIAFQWGHWQTADALQLPDSSAAQAAVARGLMADASRTLRFVYNNDTDGTQPGGSLVFNILLEAIRVDQR